MVNVKFKGKTIDKNETVEDALRDFLAGKTAKIDPNHSCAHH